jgi:hypothetical protein
MTDLFPPLVVPFLPDAYGEGATTGSRPGKPALTVRRSFCPASRCQSSGSSLTMAAPWLLPNHTETGVVWSSIQMLRMLVFTGS